MNKILYFLMIVGMMSCSDDQIIQESDITDQSLVSQLEIQNGRLIFQNKEALSNRVENLKNMSPEKACKALGKLYDKGFVSFRPIINADDQPRIDQYTELMSKQREIKKLKVAQLKDEPNDPYYPIDPVDLDDLYPYIDNLDDQNDPGEYVNTLKRKRLK